MKRFYIKNYGCQMNVYDAERMSDILLGCGCSQVDSSDDANIIVLNTCNIREKATYKALSELGRYKKLKSKKDVKIVLMGCVAQAEGEVMIKQYPFIDAVFGPRSYHKIVDVIGTDFSNCLDLGFYYKFDNLPHSRNHTGASSFISIQEGCDKFCTFCVVPYTRGNEFSRPVEDIVDEVKNVLQNGTKEIGLLGQNVSAYHGVGPDGKTWNLGQLLFYIDKVTRPDRMWYTTSHPRDMHDELYYAHRDIESLLPFFHLPVQSGSDAILKAMNRKHTVQNYYDIIDRITKYRPDIAISSDFIVGFPKEADKDFQDTVELVNNVRFATSYSFKYSPRPGTPSAYMNQVDDQTASKRLILLQALLKDHATTFNAKLVDKTIEAIILSNKNGCAVGKGPHMQKITIPNLPETYNGKIVKAKVTKSYVSHLECELL